MKRFFLCLVVAYTTISTIFASTVTLNENPIGTVLPAGFDSMRTMNLGDVMIIGNRAGLSTPVAQTNLDKKEIQSLTIANNLPHVLRMTPSLVATSENGTAAGNSSFRIRGTDASRINITLNGIPLNNPESQEVYWVNIPDMTSALQSIQVQRGVGTSTNGSGAFGASINMITRFSELKPFFESATTAGSYGTFQQNLAFGSGIFGKGNSFDLRYSNLTSDGYIRNGWCDHESLFASFVKRFDKSAVRLNYIFGNQHTGIAWEGISEEQMKKDPTFNPAGEITDGLYYDNESDNYRQHHFQAFYTQEMSANLILSAGLNYTDGFGYYEQYKQSRKFSSMGLPNQIINGISYDKSDLILRKNMDNGFYTGNINLEWVKNKIKLSGGTMYTFYDGDHYANLLWLKNNENIPANHEWSRNKAGKTDANVFIKSELEFIKGFTAYIDLQYRYVYYILSGIDDDDMQDMSQNRTWNFFNPKVGLFYELNPIQKIFASVAIAHREPTRADMKDARKYGSISDIKTEKLTDFEMGYTLKNRSLMLSANMYFMNYKDQLVPTGKLNEVGYKLMSNADKSYRAGIELSVGYKPLKWLQLEANTTLSRNRIVDYTAWFDTYDNSSDWGGADQLSKYYEEANLPFSPETITAFGIILIPNEKININFTEKYVSSQYITNTQNENLKLPAYNSANISMTYDFSIKRIAKAQIGLFVNNLFSNRYSCNAWGYEAHFANGDATYIEKGLYPVAPRNYLAKFVVKL